MISLCSRFTLQPFSHELAGQPVEQLGVRRPLAEAAEVARGADDAPAEVVHPDAVDQHAGGERVLRVA